MSYKKKRIKKVKWLNILVLLIGIICMISLIISIKNIVKWNLDKSKTQNQIDEIQQITTIEEITDNSNTEVIEQKDNIHESNPYWDYIKMDLIDVNFQNLKSINSDVKGWIQVNGTNINYPFVQHSDNQFYLNHSFDRSYNQAGWVFLDYRNNINELDNNTIIYAHGRLDNTMFGSLKNILSSGWLSNNNNYVVKLSTDKNNSLWQVFSIYHIPTTSDYLQTNFSSNQEYQKFLDKLTTRSTHNFQTTTNYNDKILTLSTCYNQNERMVLHAKLIKLESK